jgi:hypothetical protein
LTEEEQKDDRKKVIDAFIEGKKLDAYAEHRTKEMHCCWACGAIAYKRLAGVSVGDRWLCLPCLKQLKEALDSFKDIEEEMRFQAELKKKID